MEGWNYISTFYFSARIRRKYVNLCEKGFIVVWLFCWMLKQLNHKTTEPQNNIIIFIHWCFMVKCGWYCLPDSCPLLLLLSRDFVPGYSRFARYCLPGKACSRIAPLLPPLGDGRSGTGYRRLRLTIRNQRKAPPGRGWGRADKKKETSKRVLWSLL